MSNSEYESTQVIYEETKRLSETVKIVKKVDQIKLKKH
jgi:hypothetical protein